MYPLYKASVWDSKTFAAMHAKCFDKPWKLTTFRDILYLPTTYGIWCEAGLLLTSYVCDEAEILTLCVLPEYRQQGIAGAMLEMMADHLKMQHVRKMFLEVAADNQPAIRLYKKHGFTQMGMRKGYYEGKDALTMQRLL